MTGSIVSEKTLDTMPDKSMTPSASRGEIFAGYSVLTKSMIGSGMLGMAYVCARYGLVLGMVALMACGVMTWFSLYILSILAVGHPTSYLSFYSVANSIDSRVAVLLDISLVVNCWGSATSYMLLMGTSIGLFLHRVAPDAFPDEKDFKMMAAIRVISALVFVYPAFMKQINKTVVLNAVGLLCLVYITVTALASTDVSKYDSELAGPGSFVDIVENFPSFFFAYACQHNIFSVASEMRKMTLRRLNVMSILSTMTGFVIYFPLMVFPFISYGRGVDSTILSELPKNTAVLIAFIATYLSVAISYVLSIHPLRRGLLSLWYKSGVPSEGPEELKSRIVATTGAIVLGCGTALLPIKFNLVLALAGLIGCNTMCFVVPLYLYLKKRNWFVTRSKDPMALATAGMLVFCLALYPLVLGCIIYNKSTKGM